MPDSAKAVAREIWRRNSDYGTMADEWTYIRQDFFVKEVAGALTTFAAQQVQATWKQAAEELFDHCGTEQEDRPYCRLAIEFLRRAQEGQEKL